VPGGGTAFIRCLDAVGELYERLAAQKLDDAVGAAIIREALKEPLRQIAQNAGAAGDVIVEEVRKLKGNMGYNAEKGEYEDLAKSGIIDPRKVTRSALQNAASAAAMLLTTEAVVAEAPKKEKEQMPPMPPEDF
ncbi:chaperonin GroEL, partial [Candidatus Parcubacteria bacterium]|nr:chaperonin GroEL [Candidatus Parcubacteria bacterium]